MHLLSDTLLPAMAAQHAIYLFFLFALGVCVGSFLNVVVWRLPRVEHRAGEGLLRAIFRSVNAITFPRSHCPNCKHTLGAGDNIPIFGWIILKGKCRYCGLPISPKYPIFEALTGLLFAFYYVCFFLLDLGPCPVDARHTIDEFARPIALGMQVTTDWPTLLLYLFLISCLLAASLIDAETYTIPIEIPWLAAIVGIIGHSTFDTRTLYGTLSVDPIPAAIAMGGLIGLIISITLLNTHIFQQSFADGAPPLEIDRQNDPSLDATPELSRRQLNREMLHEIIFLLPPLLLAGVMVLAVTRSSSVAQSWNGLLTNTHFSGFCGAVLGALVGGFIVWLVRILGSIGFGREAMGLGDVHLMFGVGAVVGAWSATVAFFLAPFFGIVFALYKFISGKGRELPYGPFLSLGTAAAMLCSCEAWNSFSPGFHILVSIIQGKLGL